MWPTGRMTGFAVAAIGGACCPPPLVEIQLEAAAIRAAPQLWLAVTCPASDWLCGGILSAAGVSGLCAGVAKWM